MKNDEGRLRDIVGAADELSGYLAGVDAEEFVSDRLVQRAVERLLTILGEAAKEISQPTRDSIDQPWREIIRFRDKGIHGHDSLIPQRLYRIAVEAVPALRAAASAYLTDPKATRA